MLKREDIIQIFDDISKAHDKTDLNLFYDSEMNRINIYDDGCWEEMLLIKGLQRMMNVMQGYFLNAYECYLLRCIFGENYSAVMKNNSREHLIEYYEFIAAFDIDPYVINKPDNEILFNADDDRFLSMDKNYRIEETIFPLYKNKKSKLSHANIEKKKRDVVDILKRNSKRNLHDLNRNIMDLIRVDEGFKKQIGCAY